MNTFNNPVKMNRFAAKVGVLVLLAGSVLLVSQVQATTTELEAQGATQDKGEYRTFEHKAGHKGERHSGHRGGMLRMLHKLELTEAQKAEVKLVMEKYQQGGERPTQEQREAHRAQVLSLITQANFDENAAQNLVLEKQQQHQAAMVNKLKMQNEIYQLLNEEQKAQFTTHFTKMAAKHSRR
ncbi:spheroplast protein y precursor, putative [Shewanella denitrificans OS217]|jgi:periplasmic protein CpxP/Spy|uniref:Spheroplast protein y, putative n=1 Tax=Shewanella denitrificans (strain OS217 / ATCC BAA-1090 / DSM 15013) TaxID=318161 RepID=Q12IJ1_SHEDO|nr:Spy/CpxP family protein refolding chaperone [Shewanella denitrificans]ABE56735.1 spheroplast protein y precursor, putative [Shewanella denitrificans OS217]